MQLDRQVLEEQMKVAYQELAEENIRICEDFKFSDMEKVDLALKNSLAL